MKTETEIDEALNAEADKSDGKLLEGQFLTERVNQIGAGLVVSPVHGKSMGFKINDHLFCMDAEGFLDMLTRFARILAIVGPSLVAEEGIKTND